MFVRNFKLHFVCIKTHVSLLLVMNSRLGLAATTEATVGVDAVDLRETETGCCELVELKRNERNCQCILNSSRVCR